MSRPAQTPDGPGVKAADPVVLGLDGLDALITKLSESGYEVKGPVSRGGAVVPGSISGVDDLPAGVHDEQSPGGYRLAQGDDGRLFAWAVGPGSWKGEFFPAHQEVWRARASDEAIEFTEAAREAAPLAIVGARPCEFRALEVLDRVLKDGAYRDPRYADRREAAFVAVVECASPASTCFCTSMGTGPGIEGGFDLALTEIDDEGGHRFVVRVGSEDGSEMLDSVPSTKADAGDLEARARGLEGAAANMGRHLQTEGLAGLLARNMDHPRWSDVGERCLSCGNCTLVCPTCFCSDVHDTTDISGESSRARVWSSCFDLDHSYLHGGAVRASCSSRYRQWMTHKLSTWWDQFDTSGCVGCGRCVTWCPVGIDITEEAAFIAASDGATRVSPPSTRGGS